MLRRVSESLCVLSFFYRSPGNRGDRSFSIPSPEGAGHNVPQPHPCSFFTRAKTALFEAVVAECAGFEGGRFRWVYREVWGSQNSYPHSHIFMASLTSPNVFPATAAARLLPS